MTFLEMPLRPDRAVRLDGAGIDWWNDRGWPPVPLPRIVGLLLVAVLAAGAARVTYAATYQPLSFGTGAYGPVPDYGFKPVRDGFATTRWLLTAKPGTTATFMYAIANDGDDPVTIYDVPASPDDPFYTSMGWAPVDFHSLAYVIRRLPAVVQPHQSIELMFSIRKPDCAGQSGTTEIEALPIHYRAFGFSHSLAMPLSGTSVAPIDVCWSPPSS